MQEMSKQTFKVCFCFRRIFKLRALEPPEIVKELFRNYSQNGAMNAEDLRRFLIDIEGEDHATLEDAQTIFNNLKHLNVFQRKEFHLEAFFRYIMSDLNAALPPSLGVHHDMNAPLAHYFMFTSHNTYLTGNQLSSNSSTEPIKYALRKGVRVIELDLWPSSKKDNVEVRHGGTLTAPVDLIKCLRIIKENAFSTSEYPVVITFEDHLTPNLQCKVAEMVTKTFGNMLYCPESYQMKEFPSPESLKRRILISTKPPKKYLETQGGQVNERVSQRNTRKSSKKKKWRDEKTSSRSEFETNDKEQRTEEEHFPDEEDEEKEVYEYRNIIAIHAGKLKGELENMLSIEPNKVRRLSLSELELESAAKTHATQIIKFTQKNMLRIYPKGSRLLSSNYDPFVGWKHGAQMVAFNMQGYGKHLWVMQGMFKANGGCGYVKKPHFLLEPDPRNDSFNSHVKKVLKVKVYMGEGWDLEFHHTHFDLFSPPDFFVKIAVAGVAADKAKNQTKVIDDDWLPEWNEEFEFRLTVPELAVLRIVVYEYDTSGKHDFGGQTCLPISELRTGIRCVPLHNRKGEKYKYVRLLMQFEFS